MDITIALLQMTALGDDQEANRAKGEAFCRQAHAMGADIALFPEMWNIGYTSYSHVDIDTTNIPTSDLWKAPELWNTSPDPLTSAQIETRIQWQEQAISRDDPFVTHFRQLAKELGMAIALTYLEKWKDGKGGESAPRNTVSLIDRHGELVMTYAKVHTCDFDEMEDACTPGDDFFVCTLDTEKGDVQIGAMICFDREFPESARILMLKGAELILTPNSCPMEINRIAQFRTRAYENMVGVALANYAAPQQNGHSLAFDPMAFDENGNARDTLVIEAGENEGVYLARFDMDRIRQYRLREAWGNAFRKPHRYGLLSSLDVESPFIRVNEKGEMYDRGKR